MRSWPGHGGRTEGYQIPSRRSRFRTRLSAWRMPRTFSVSSDSTMRSLVDVVPHLQIIGLKFLALDPAQPSALLRKKSQTGNASEGGAKLRRSRPSHPAKDFREVAWTHVADFQRDLDEAARGFADELLRAADPLARHELQR